jgi:hypothetical protein
MFILIDLLMLNFMNLNYQTLIGIHVIVIPVISFFVIFYQFIILVYYDIFMLSFISSIFLHEY